MSALTSLIFTAGCSDSPAKRYEVLLDIDSTYQVNARIFPDAKVKQIKIEKLATLGAEPVTTWEAEASSGDNALEAGAILTMGALPAGWMATTPFEAFEAGKKYVFTVKTSDGGSGIATWTYVVEPVQPELVIQSVPGEINVRLAPAVSATSVKISDSSGVLWSAEFPDAAGALIPSDGMEIGNAPVSWESFVYDLNENLVDGQAYTISVEIPQSGMTVSAQTLTAQVVFQKGASPQWSLAMTAPALLRSGDSGSFHNRWRLFEANGDIVSFPSIMYTSAGNYGNVTLDSHVALSNTLFLTPTPNYRFTVAPAPLNNVKSAGQPSHPVALDSGRVAIAQVMSDTAATFGKLYVMESLPSSLYNIADVYDVTSGWSFVGGTAGIGSGLGVAARVSPRLVRRIVPGLPGQNTAKPYIVSAFNQSSSFNPQMYYFNSSNTWTSINVGSFVPAAGFLTGVDIAATDDGKLYACVSQIDNSVSPQKKPYKVLRYEPVSTTWIPVATNENAASLNTNPNETETCRITSSGDAVYAMGKNHGEGTRNIWANKIVGDAVVADLSISPVEFAALFQLSSPMATANGELFDLRAEGDQLYAALNVSSGSDGSAPYLGPKQYLVAHDGGKWIRVASGRLSGFQLSVQDGVSEYVLAGLRITDDLTSLIACSSALAYYVDGITIRYRHYGAHWRLGEP